MKDGTLFKRPIEDIIFIKSDDNYCRFYLANNVHHVVRHTLKGMEEKLSSFGFFRCHRQYVINLKKIKMIDTRQNKVILDEGYEVKFSRAKKRELLGLIK